MANVRFELRQSGRAASSRSASVRTGCSTALLTALLAATTVHAQPVSSELPESWMSSWPDGPASTGLVPSIWWDRRGIGITAGGTLAIDLSRIATLQPGTAWRDGVLLELGAYGAGPTLRSPRSSRALSARLHLARQDGGVWFASSGFQSEDEARALPSLGAGFWAQRGPFTITVQAMHLLDPLRVAQPTTYSAATPDTTVTEVDPRHPHMIMVDDVRLLNGGEASLSVAFPRVELQSRVGLAAGDHRRSARWAELGASFWARRQVAVFARARTAAEMPSALDGLRGSQVAVGIQLAPGRAAGAIAGPRPDRRFALTRVGDAGHRLEFRVAAERLELRSDATGWSAVEARKLGANRWEVVLPLDPGVHRIEIRIDGGVWAPPPGLPTTHDEFGGEVGLLVVD